MRHGGIGDAGEEVAREFDFGEKGGRRFEALLAAGGIVDHEIKLVQLKPHFRRNNFPDRPGVFTRGTQAGDDGVRIVAVEGQKLDDVVLRGLAAAFSEVLVVPGRVHQRLPLPSGAVRSIEHEVQIDIDEARHVFRPLDVAAHPVD